MKNKYFSFVALAAAALATSCASDDLAEQEQNQDESQTVTLTAAVNEGETRVGMKKESSSSASFYWHSGDKILVQTQKGSTSTYGGAEFATATATGNTLASFTGGVTTGYKVAGYAVYPYDSSKQQHSFTGAKALNYVLPSSYTNYKPGTKIFGTTSDYPSNPTNMPMLGTISSNKISFKCLGGLAVIRVDKMPITSGKLTVSASESLAGSFSVALGSSAEMKNSTTVSNGASSVTFNFSGATANSEGVFYLPLATGSYTNFQVTLSNNSGYNQVVSKGTLTISRAGVTAVPIVAYVKVNGYWFADLGLDVLWATMNVGASKPEESGGYYAWGETKTKTEYTSANYSTDYSSYTKAGKTLVAKQDVATVKWKSPCRMPTKAEMKELLSSTCTWTWDEEKYGYTVTSTTNGNSIFLYGGGYKGDASGNDEYKGCYYWTSETSTSVATDSESVYYLRYDTHRRLSTPGVVRSSKPYFGDHVRPVVKKQ